MDEQLEFIKLVAGRLESAGIPYMLTGSMAMALYAEPRMTRDLDFVIECTAKDASRIASLFKDDCYVDEASVRSAAIERSIFNVVHTEWVLKADFIVRRDEEYRRVEFGRRERMDIGEVSLFVVQPEDLILSKLSWSMEGESALQLRDARLLAATAPHLDWGYLEKWAGSLGLTGLLEEIRPA